MNAIVKVEFHGDTVSAVREGETVLVPVKPIVERLGMAWNGQLERIKRDEVLRSSMREIRIDTPAGARDAAALPLDVLPGFLFGMETDRIPDPEVRATALTYKRECYAVLYRHFFGPKEEEPVDRDLLAENLQLVKQARLAFGRKAAQAMWNRLGLPPIEDDPPEAAAAESDGMMSYLNDFLEECTERGAGGMCQAGELFKLYSSWASANSAPYFTQVGFGKAIVRAGIRRRKSRHQYYLGIRIRHDARIRLTGLP